jgi:hypothetical protein
MITTKLTLSADRQIVSDAKRLAEARHTSVSALFSRFVAGLKQVDRAKPEKLGPVTYRASGLVRLSKKISDQDLVADALNEKYAR